MDGAAVDTEEVLLPSPAQLEAQSGLSTLMAPPSQDSRKEPHDTSPPRPSRGAQTNHPFQFFSVDSMLSILVAAIIFPNGSSF